MKNAVANDVLLDALFRIKDNVAAIDNKFTITYVNRAFANSVGLKVSEMLGKNMLTLLPKSTPFIKDKISDSINNQKIVNFEWKGPYSNLFLETTIFPSDKGATIISRDVTKRKKTEETLKENERLYKAVFDNNQDAFQLFEITYDKNGKPIDQVTIKINQTFEKLTGIKAIDIVGKSIKELAPDVDPSWFKIYDTVLKTGKGIHTEVYHNFEEKYYDAYYFPYSKKTVGLLYRDITERKKAEQNLNRKEAELASIIESSPIIIFYKDKHGKFIQANKAFAKVLDVEREDLIGKTVFDLYAPDIARQMANDDLAVMKSKKPKTGIIEPYNTPNGLRWLQTYKIPAFDETGKVNGIIGFSEEITERKKTQEALLQAKVKYEQLVEKLPEMVFEISSEGKVIFANSRALEILGYSKEELENDFDANRLVAPEDVERSRNNMRAMFNGQMHHSNEYTFVKKDGARFPVLLNSSPVFVENKIVGACGLIIDLTESKNTERQLHAQERLAAIGLTAGMVGHDIRNPLQAILSDVYLIKEFLTSMPEQTTKEDVSESLCEIEKNIEYINKIVADLQDYARPLTPDCSSVDISEVMTNVVKGAHVPDNIHVDIVSNTFMRIKSDTTFIRRILTNLVNNAIQAMPNGGELELTCFSKKDKMFVTISDTGVGIPDHFKQNIFSPMMTTKSKGQGLGLAVAKRLVEAINGKIDFESELGKGTKFKIELTSLPPTG